MRIPRIRLSCVAFLVLALGCEPKPGPIQPDAGTSLCIIGDADVESEIELVYRDVDGLVKPLADGGEVPLIQPPQGGKVAYIGVRAKNVTCSVLLSVGFFDDCRDPPIIFSFVGNPVRLEEDQTGFGVPVNNVDDPFVPNLMNVPVCPSAVSTRDSDDNLTRFELRVTEALREGEADNRRHVIEGSVVPVCGRLEEEAILCRCECDADFLVGVPKDEQCPTINDNDLPAGECPAEGEGEGEGE